MNEQELWIQGQMIHHYKLSIKIVSYQEKDEQFLASAHFFNFGT
jgi:hypothetical protein